MIGCFILGMFTAFVIILACLWVMKPEEFDKIKRRLSIGGGGIKPPKEKND